MKNFKLTKKLPLFVQQKTFRIDLKPETQVYMYIEIDKHN